MKQTTSQSILLVCMHFLLHLHSNVNSCQGRVVAKIVNYIRKNLFFYTHNALDSDIG